MFQIATDQKRFIFKLYSVIVLCRSQNCFNASSIGWVIWSQLRRCCSGAAAVLRRCWRRCWSLTLALVLTLALTLALVVTLVLTLALTLTLVVTLVLTLTLTLTLNTNSRVDLLCEGTNINFICRRSEEANHETLILWRSEGANSRSKRANHKTLILWRSEGANSRSKRANPRSESANSKRANLRSEGANSRSM